MDYQHVNEGDASDDNFLHPEFPNATSFSQEILRSIVTSFDQVPHHHVGGPICFREVQLLDLSDTAQFHDSGASSFPHQILKSIVTSLDVPFVDTPCFHAAHLLDSSTESEVETASVDTVETQSVDMDEETPPLSVSTAGPIPILGSKNPPGVSASVSFSGAAPKSKRSFPEHSISKFKNNEVKDFRAYVLSRYSVKLIESIKLCSADAQCEKHCSKIFQSYLDMIAHYQENKLMSSVFDRNYRCPVHECPLHVIGTKNRADLRHHVHYEHITNGYVHQYFKQYDQNIKDILFVCSEPDCGKSFYRSDSLTRHLRLVHKEKKTKKKKRRRGTSWNSRDEEEYGDGDGDGEGEEAEEGEEQIRIPKRRRKRS
ncbi:uncharacterized protein LODBEIA_P43760 [Lodderomyces beijingensis]|uniref:C2H2-type domain-containing protein n=1 Tax=Lodderomyces beijingensis TaxID=1775926 RepID=A0ABP0ZPU2_9ASCO